jgi:bacterial/archaeal transporter family-2 protein
MPLAFLLLAVAAGGALPFQAGINARLASFIGGPIRASAISFAVGTVVLVLLALAATRGVVSTGRLGSVPWWGVARRHGRSRVCGEHGRCGGSGR